MSKIRKEKQELARVQQINSLKNDFPLYVPNTERNKRIIKHSELIDWDKVLFLFEKIINDLLEKIEIPNDYENSEEAMKKFRDTIFLFLKHQYYHLIILAWNDKQNKKNSLEQYQMINRVQEYVELEIKRISEFIKLSMDYSILKPITFYENLNRKSTELQKKLSKYQGQKYKKGNLLKYSEALEKNDEYKKKYGKSNYTRAVFNVTNYSGTKLNNFRKAFDNFMTGTGIRTYKQFKDSKYYIIVEEYKKTINYSRLEKKSPPA
jgi:hypothetical protein